MPSRCCSPRLSTSPHSLRTSHPPSRSSRYLRGGGGGGGGKVGQAGSIGSCCCSSSRHPQHRPAARTSPLHHLPATFPNHPPQPHNPQQLGQLVVQVVPPAARLVTRGHRLLHGERVQDLPGERGDSRRMAVGCSHVQEGSAGRVAATPSPYLPLRRSLTSPCLPRPPPPPSHTRRGASLSSPEVAPFALPTHLVAQAARGGVGLLRHIVHCGALPQALDSSHGRQVSALGSGAGQGAVAVGQGPQASQQAAEGGGEVEVRVGAGAGSRRGSEHEICTQLSKHRAAGKIQAGQLAWPAGKRLPPRPAAPPPPPPQAAAWCSPEQAGLARAVGPRDQQRAAARHLQAELAGQHFAGGGHHIHAPAGEGGKEGGRRGRSAGVDLTKTAPAGSPSRLSIITRSKVGRPFRPLQPLPAHT